MGQNSLHLQHVIDARGLLEITFFPLLDLQYHSAPFTGQPNEDV